MAGLAGAPFDNGLIFWLVPVAPQPVREQADGLCVEDLVLAKFWHPVVAFAVITIVCRIRNQPDKPFARTVRREVGRGGPVCETDGTPCSAFRRW